MKLSQLASKPQLIRIVIDDQEVMDEYGEELEFWIYDRQDMDSFVKLATMDITQFDQMADLMRKMILDETGKEIIADGMMLPTNIMMMAIQKVVEALGKHHKSVTKS